MTDPTTIEATERALNPYFGPPATETRLLEVHAAAKVVLATLTPLIRADALEEAAKVVEEVAAIYDARLEQGKGEHCTPGYVRDDTWNQWLGKYSITTELVATLRALKEQP